MVDLGNPDVILPEGRKHAIVDPPELPLRDQLPSGGVLVRHDHQAPALLLEEAHARNRTGQELEMIGRADVSRSSAIDQTVTIEVDRRARLRSRSPPSLPAPLLPQAPLRSP